jgi:hyaluronan synthase
MPRMLDVCFVFGCDFMRCAQSVLGYVLCTPGAISAYRRETVTPLLGRWQEQKFLGAPSTIGEDRALTSLILRSGKKVVCQSNAVAFTQVPDRYSNLCKMLLRWTRGDVRESLMLMDYVTGRWSLRDWKWSLFQLNIASQIVGMMLPFVFIPCTIYTLIQFNDHIPFMIYYTFSINSVWSLLPAVIYARRDSATGAMWAFVYGVFSLIALSWICVYSILTLRNSSWLTREVKNR